MSSIVKMSRLPVMCSTAIGAGEGVQGAIDAVETSLHKNLRGRKCYGVISYDENGEMTYKACVVILLGDNPKELGLEATEIPAGKYVRERVRNFDYRTDVPRVIATFDRLAGENEVDNTRPSLEFYRRHDEIVVHVPVK